MRRSPLAIGISDVTKELEKHKEQFAKCINATCSDFAKSGPGWVSQEVTKVYGIKPSDFKTQYRGYTKAGKIKIGHVPIDNIKLRYSGRTLTIKHFGMTPTQIPKRKPYKVSAAVFKGRKKMVSSKAFIATANNSTLAWKRVGRDRMPIRPVKTLSAPQMVTSQYTEIPIQRRISYNLAKRWDHHVDRFNK